MINQIDYNIFRCPITNEDLFPAEEAVVRYANCVSGIENCFDYGLVNQSKSFFFPVKHEILFLLDHYSIPLNQKTGIIKKMHFDKQRIFSYFSAIDFFEFEGQQIYADAYKFVDFRPFTLEYTQHGFYNTRQYIKQRGKYFVDVGCGPVAFKEYIFLAEGFDCRICIDLSANALMQAKKNLVKHNQPGIFVCADIINLPIKDNIADAVICQHVLFHVQKNLQLKAMEELVRIAKQETKVAIVYDWFYHSLLMNITLGPYQLYRIIRHYAGKVYARFFKKNKLYFYSHSQKWFFKNHPGRKLDIYIWRSINKHFADIFLHEKLGGKRLIKFIWNIEKKYPEKMGRIGEYPVIVIEK
ncbi:MAG TPA: class I SAM-dependent methyltransferase [Puia sp.]|nr:class I SAM-dependent methyltransferase [Puia sp.]